MNRINPLHVAALLLVIILFLFLKVGTLKDELSKTNDEYHDTKTLALKLSSLKKIYTHKQKTKQKIEKILRQNYLKSAHLEIQQGKTSIKISSKAIDAKALKFLMNKFLNGTFIISSLSIKKQSKTSATLEMEIQW